MPADGPLDVVVSPARCIASKACVHAAPHVFAVLGGTASVVDPAGDPLEDVLAAAEACPTGAISVRRDEERLA